jgi:hypothetical protein
MIDEGVEEYIEGHQKIVDERGVGSPSQAIYRRIKIN